ncbi:hypothetical protein ACJ73_06053 [Blastomyces percursus]|uniref:Fork-head domain-containing protein n=1 Tax=Blastomyces percursus TaxID=1658174 RepID=A0A1J9R286_9EURO|nr:hypothetical protein ACJ73_06053 [Blastomyces percursus]
MSLLPPDNFRGQVPGAQQRDTPKQEPTHFFRNSEDYISCSTIEDWASTNRAGPVPYNQPDFQFNPWSVGSTQGHLLKASHTPRQNPYGFSISQPSDVPAMTISHPHTVQLKSVGSPHQQPESVAMSPAFSTLSYDSFQLGNSRSSPINVHPEYDGRRAYLEEEGNTDPPYSFLIYQALLSAPGGRLPLQEIYSWFEENTEKAKDQSSKGWKNSIRHNLSMNAGFECVKEGPKGKGAVSYWRLTPKAMKDGIQFTTRYRKPASQKKALSSESPTPQRQRPGTKGERSRLRFNTQARMNDTTPVSARSQVGGSRRISTAEVPSVLPVHVPSPAPVLVRPSVETFDPRHVVRCTDYSPTTPIFYGIAATQPDYFGVDINSPHYRDGQNYWSLAYASSISWPTDLPY